MLENTQYSERMTDLERRRRFNEWIVSIGYCVYQFHYFNDFEVSYTMDDKLLDIPLKEYLEKVPEKDRKKRTEYYLKGFSHFVGYSLDEGKKVTFYWYDNSYAGSWCEFGTFNSFGIRVSEGYIPLISFYIKRLLNSSDYKVLLGMQEEKLLEYIKNRFGDKMNCKEKTRCY